MILCPQGEKHSSPRQVTCIFSMLLEAEGVFKRIFPFHFSPKHAGSSLYTQGICATKSSSISFNTKYFPQQLIFSCFTSISSSNDPKDKPHLTAANPFTTSFKSQVEKDKYWITSLIGGI